jgi:hypothetical protein
VADAPGKESGARTHRGGWRDDGVERRLGARWHPHQREGRRRLWLAPRAVREDERGEGGSKTGNEGRLVGLTVGGWGGGGTVTAAVGNMLVTAVILASEANGPSQGWTGKAVTCLSAGAKKLGREATREKGGGSARCHVGAREERKGRGRGAAPCEPARHRRGGSGPLGQRRAEHVT